jgi:hypothetical protein
VGISLIHQSKFKEFGLTPDLYIKNICFHEAAHAAMVLNKGANLEKVEIIHDSDKVPARIKWKPQKMALEDIVDIFTAGPAVNDSFQEFSSLSEKYKDHLYKNEHANCMKYLDLIINKFNPDLKKPSFEYWNKSYNNSIIYIKKTNIYDFIDKIAEKIKITIDNNENEVDIKFILDLWSRQNQSE